MNVTREVILDLLPVYLSGEASPATRALIEQYMVLDRVLRNPTTGADSGILNRYSTQSAMNRLVS